VSKKFEQWEVLDIVSRLEQNDSHPVFTEIVTQRDAIENELRDSELSFQNKALVRAKQLSQATSIHKHHKDIDTKVSIAHWVVIVIMLFLGGFAVINVFNNDITRVNIFWLIIVLLGVNTFSMLLYLATSLQKQVDLRSIPSLLFKMVLSLSSKKPTLVPSINSDGKPVSPTNKHSYMSSWSTINLTGNIGRWSFSRYLHGAWLAYLLGALATLVLVLLAKQIDFVWGTTLLNGDFFIQLTSGMSQLQSSLGLPTLSTDQILLSRVDSASNQTASTQDLAKNRQQWAYFLIVSLLLYGIFPRLLLWCYSVLQQHRAKKAYQPEWNTPYFVQLRERMIPSSSAAAIIDADTHKQAPVSGIAENEIEKVNSKASKQRIDLIELANHLPHETALLAYEWFPRHPWPVTDAINNWGMISNREQQLSLIQKLQQNTQRVELAICLSSEQVADRGALRFFSDLNQHAELYLLIVNFIDHKQLKRRWTEWLHLADQLKIKHERVLLVDARSSGEANN